MTNKNMDAVLEQVGVMTGAVKKILEVVGDEMGYFDEKRLLYIDSDGEPSYVDEEEAYKISGKFEDRIEFQFLGDSDYVVVYDSDDRVVIAGDTYLLGNYFIGKVVDDKCCGVTDDEIENLEIEYRCCIRPFVIDDEMIMAVLL